MLNVSQRLDYLALNVYFGAYEKMFGFGLKLKPKSKPLLSAARRPRDQVSEANASRDENISPNTEISDCEGSEKIPSVGSGHVEPVMISGSHFKTSDDNVKKDETALKTEPPSISSVNDSNQVIGNDSNRSHPSSDSSKTSENDISSAAVSGKENYLTDEKLTGRETDKQPDSSILINHQKNAGSNFIAADDFPIVVATSVSHVGSVVIIPKTAETLPVVSKTCIGNYIQNQSTVNELPKDKEPLSYSKQTADEGNTYSIHQINNSRNILQNNKEKKPQAEGAFRQMINATRKELNEKLKDGNLDKSKLIMRDLIFYNPSSNPMPVWEEGISSEESVDDVEKTPTPTDYMPVPQLKVGPDGKIILDSTSLVIETGGTKKGRNDIKNCEQVQENDSSTRKYTRKRNRRIIRKRRNVWNVEETVMFYKALNTIGSDFSVMETVFPDRTRRDLKSKFKREEKRNLVQVNIAMLLHSDFDLEGLKKELERDRAEIARKQQKKIILKKEARKVLKQQKQEARIEKKKLKSEAKNKEKQQKLEAKMKAKKEKLEAKIREKAQKEKNKKNKTKRAAKNSSQEVERNQNMPTNKRTERWRGYNMLSSDSDCFDNVPSHSIDYRNLFKSKKYDFERGVRDERLIQIEKNIINEELNILREKLEKLQAKKSSEQMMSKITGATSTTSSTITSKNFTIIYDEKGTEQLVLSSRVCQPSVFTSNMAASTGATSTTSSTKHFTIIYDEKGTYDEKAISIEFQSVSTFSCH
ncbi:transcription factor TFIIIB component B'' homolog isoform X2 [Nilaparvata lugens]|uniref:transcription factor TFIIIB component B'' homolog isoform X2 n=2 Tax=Nilaparvata lugens TaxID=108931 RepID=UPI00193D87B2|nr:transcription factor TFIIIB component B'' homolog isoform X2 [Nilaparvata lugens]